MNHLHRPALSSALGLGFLTLLLAGCATGPQLDQPAAPAVVQTLPPAFPPQDIVGRWALPLTTRKRIGRAPRPQPSPAANSRT